ncbi:MAG: DUF4476 domain-containing protein [Proteobacteria bacterium]|nr:DUF4476 domain-containing protein [Pseudomonadota bacterium]
MQFISMKAKLCSQIVFLLAFAACSVQVGKKDNADGGDAPDGRPSNGSNQNESQPKEDYVDWPAVSRDNNPEIETTDLNLSGVVRINADLYGFTKDVNLEYRDDLPAQKGQVLSYSVMSGSTPVWSKVSVSLTDGFLKVTRKGDYRCAISVENKSIKSLDGQCYVRIDIRLPKNAQIEVENVGQLLSKRFLPVTADSLVEAVKKAVVKEDKLAVIADFLESYKVTEVKPSLTVVQFKKVLSEFAFKDDKFEVLRKLHATVADRTALSMMIDQEFTYFDRAEAKAIAGL